MDRRREILAGLTNFFTVSYILAVNPAGIGIFIAFIGSCGPRGRAREVSPMLYGLSAISVALLALERLA